MFEQEEWIQGKYQELRPLILSVSSEIQESIKFNAPFYTYKGFLLYFSVIKKGNKLVLGFCDGHLMSDEENILQANEGQTQIRHWVLQLEGLEKHDVLLRYINEAILIKEELYKLKTTSKKQRQWAKK
ncbi:MAG: DUF1801 domain-containing protein [Bacteroidetes bacterium]|nr:DUF1801 domain-containing protein [Bacteroidota bacterium]